MALRIRLEGRLLEPEEHSPLEGGELTFSRGEDQSQTAGFARAVEFYGQAAERIRAELIDAPDARERFVRADLVDDCCDLTLLQGRIGPDSVDWCEGECAVGAAVAEFSPQAEQLDCLERTLVADDRNGFRSRTHPFVRYCLELRPGVLHDIVIVYMVIINLVLAILTPVVFMLNLVVKIVDAVVGAIAAVVSCGACRKIDRALDVNLVNEFRNMVDRLNDLAIGCNRGHISPYARSYLENVCDLCGLTLDASSENLLAAPASPWYNTVYFHAPYRKGWFDYLSGGAPDARTVDEYFRWNGPEHTGAQLLDELARVFNAEWRVENGRLYFGVRRPRPEIWLDTAELPEGAVEELCYDYSGETQPAFARFAYAPDAVDWVGNEAKNRYNEIVDYNAPVRSPNRRGERANRFPYGMARFRDDGLDRDVISTYRNFPFVSAYISNDYNELLLLPSGVAFQPKLLIHDPRSGFNNAKIVWETRTGGGRDYNKPFYMKADDPESLYNRVWAQEDPRRNPRRGVGFRLRFRYDCRHLETLNLAQSVVLPAGTGTIQEVSVSGRTMTVQGVV